MEEAWLSVIVPSHNGQRWLSTALQSIADQKERGIEVIVIDSSTEYELSNRRIVLDPICNSGASAT